MFASQACDLQVPAVPSHDLSSKQAGEHRGKGAGATKPAANAAQSGGVKATVKTVDSQKSGQAKHAAAEGIAAAKPVPARPAGMSPCLF